MKFYLKILFFILILSTSVSADSGDRLNNAIGNFEASIKKGEVSLNWRIINPSNLYKFRIESKKAGMENYLQLDDLLFVNFRKREESDTLTSYYYTYSDSPQENGVYFYKVSAYDINNKVVTSEEIKVGITEVPEFKLHQNNPNPFNPSTVISYEILVPTNVKLEIFSLTGKFVDILADGFQTPGIYNVEFNTAKYGDISSGIYFYKLETNYTSDIRKMIFTK